MEPVTIGVVAGVDSRLLLHRRVSIYASYRASMSALVLNASTEERAMMSSWRVTLLALGFRRSNRPAGDVDQAIIEG